MRLNWLSGKLKLIGRGSSKEVFQLKRKIDGKDVVVKKMNSYGGGDTKAILERRKELEKNIPDNLPERYSFVIAADDFGITYLWLVTEKIKGRDINDLNAYERLFQKNELILPQYYAMIRKDLGLDRFGSNFLWDRERKRLFYVDD